MLSYCSVLIVHIHVHQLHNVFGFTQRSPLSSALLHVTVPIGPIIIHTCVSGRPSISSRFLLLFVFYIFFCCCFCGTFTFITTGQCRADRKRSGGEGGLDLERFSSQDSNSGCSCLSAHCLLGYRCWQFPIDFYRQISTTGRGSIFFLSWKS